MPVKPDITADKVNTGELAAVIIPGDYAPDKMRINPGMLRIVREMLDGGKVVASICHAGWVTVKTANVSKDLSHKKAGSILTLPGRFLNVVYTSGFPPSIGVIVIILGNTVLVSVLAILPLTIRVNVEIVSGLTAVFQPTPPHGGRRGKTPGH